VDQKVGEACPRFACPVLDLYRSIREQLAELKTLVGLPGEEIRDKSKKEIETEQDQEDTHADPETFIPEKTLLPPGFFLFGFHANFFCKISKEMYKEKVNW